MERIDTLGAEGAGGVLSLDQVWRAGASRPIPLRKGAAEQSTRSHLPRAEIFCSASVPAAATMWSPAQQQCCCQDCMQETTYKYAVATSTQSARGGFSHASSRVRLAVLAPVAAAVALAVVGDFNPALRCSWQASVPATTTVWFPAQQQYLCHKYMQETTYKYSVATSQQSA